MKHRKYMIVLLSILIVSMSIPMIFAPVRRPHDHIGNQGVKDPKDGGDKSLEPWEPPYPTNIKINGGGKAIALRYIKTPPRQDDIEELSELSLMINLKTSEPMLEPYTDVPASGKAMIMDHTGKIKIDVEFTGIHYQPHMNTFYTYATATAYDMENKERLSEPSSMHLNIVVDDFGQVIGFSSQYRERYFYAGLRYLDGEMLSGNGIALMFMK